MTEPSAPFESNSQQDSPVEFIQWFRHSSPYINAHRDKRLVVAVDGDSITRTNWPTLLHDIALMNSLGPQIVLVLGIRPHIDERLREANADPVFQDGWRITDELAMRCAKEAAGMVRVETEAMLSMGIANSPMAGYRLRVASGNYVTARPMGVIKGVDYQFTGQVRRIDTEAIKHHLQQHSIVLLTPMGYSPTGEAFNLSSIEVATETAIAIKADKLIFIRPDSELLSPQQHRIREMSIQQAMQRLAQADKMQADKMQADKMQADKVQTGKEQDRGALSTLQNSVVACQQGVNRVHILPDHIDGILLRELYTRDGAGTMIAADRFEALRRASIEDVGGILELIQPLEENGVLVRRSRDQLELEIENFFVTEKDGMITACAALYSYEQDIAELACVAVHPNYQKVGLAATLIREVEKQAHLKRVHKLFVLTTHTAHWFQEQGFEPATIGDLPIKKQAMYNLQRNSKVFIKTLR